jgi:putative hydrolase of the HAD superfamily
LRYDALFLDVDKTILWVDLDVEGYVEDLSPYARNGPLTVEEACGPLWEGLREHINESWNYPTEEDLAGFRRENARKVAGALNLDAPDEVLIEVSERRTLFVPYPESEEVMEELKGMGLPLYVVSNWDVELEKVLGSLGWLRYFDGVVASAVVGSEKPDGRIFEEALEAAGVPRDRVAHVGNDPVSDVRGAANAGIDAVLVDRERRRSSKASEAVAVLPDLCGLPGLVRG